MQDVVTIAGQAAPPPGQLAAARAEVVVTHAAARQTVDAEYFSHIPAPLHAPSFPHVEAAVAAHCAPSVAECGSGWPAGTGAQVPGDAPLHV